MAKIKKKRNKQYTGSEASVKRPTITRVVAEHRNPIRQWWLDKKVIAKPIGIASAVVLGLIWLVFELIRLFS